MSYMRGEAFDLMTHADRHRDAHDTPEARAIMDAGKEFMRTIERNTSVNARQQRALAYADIATLIAIASIADGAA